jgi:hypothetical protein
MFHTAAAFKTVRIIMARRRTEFRDPFYLFQLDVIDLYKLGNLVIGINESQQTAGNICDQYDNR